MAISSVPILVWAGGALLGWVAGDIMIKDDALKMQIDPLVIDEAARLGRGGRRGVCGRGGLLDPIATTRGSQERRSRGRVVLG